MTAHSKGVLSSSDGPLVLGLLGLFGAVVIFALTFRARRKKGPPSLPDTIPFVSNTYLFLLHASKFFGKAREALGNKTLAKWHLGLRTVYIINGQKNVQSLLRASPHVDSEAFMLEAMRNSWNVPEYDLQRFVRDKSGRLKTPNPGTESIRYSQRYWANVRRLYDEYLAKPRHATALATKFLQVFSKKLDAFPLGEWAATSIFAFINKHMSEAAIISLQGSRRLIVAPDTAELYREYEHYVFHILWGVPRLFIPKAYRAMDEFHASSEKYLHSAWKNFDWDGPDAESDWEPHFGSRFSRELARWMKESGFSQQAANGFFSAILLQLNADAVPITAWMLMYLIKDQELFLAVRDEVMGVFSTDPSSTGLNPKLDRAKLMKLPLLQAVYAETLRLHVSFIAMRQTKADLEFDGRKIDKGSWVQAVTAISHLDEAVWARDGHPASEFWPGRHLTYRQERDEHGKFRQVAQFSISDSAGAFFPFGGGTGICPGRNFAKQEILMACSTIIAKFDIEPVEWINHDGSISDREARDDEKYSGTGSMTPDRDMKILWKRLW